MRVTPTRSYALADQRCQTSCLSRLASAGPRWHNPRDLHPGCCMGHMSGSMKAIFSRPRYAIEFRTMCDGALSCCRVHSWRPLASYAFIEIKLVSCRLLLYAAYTCQNAKKNHFYVYCCDFVFLSIAALDAK